MNKLFLIITVLFLMSEVKSQCLGNEIVYTVNSNSLIQKRIKETFKLKGNYPVRPLIDTAGVDLDLNIVLFRDSLLTRRYSKRQIDSIITVTRQKESVPLKPKFCDQQALFPSDTNYNPKLNNLVMFVGECHKNAVICEVRKCTGNYKGYDSDFSDVFLTILFFYDRQNHIYDFIVYSGRSSSPDVPIFEDQ